jgi:hypothetical protein
MYEIKLKGHLDQRHEEWLAGFSMARHPSGETVLTGRIIDQAALYGLLLRIRDLGIVLISVNEIDPGHVRTKG